MMKIKLSNWLGMGVFVMVLVGYRNNDNKLKIWENVDWIVSHSDRKHLHQNYYLQYTKFLSLSKKESVTVRPAFFVHISSKNKQIKRVPVLTSSLVP